MTTTHDVGPAPIAFVDCETTGLDADRHQIWEVAVVTRMHDGGEPGEHRWLLPVDLSRADPVSLKIGRFHERHPQGYDYTPEQPDEWCTSLTDFARMFASLTQGCHLAGAVVSFDEERLRRLLLASGALPEWHYHLIDVENLAAGWLASRCSSVYSPAFAESARTISTPPWDSEALSRALGIEPERFARHTALGDVRWAMSIYDAVMNVD